MKIKTNTSVFATTNVLKILSFLSEYPNKEFLGNEVQKSVSLSRAGVYIALRELIKQKLVTKTQKGKFLMYGIIYNDPVVRQFKILQNIIFLRPIIEKLKLVSKRIILYGSASRGEDDVNSDLDIFLLSQDPSVVRNVLSSLKLSRKIQWVVKTPSEFADFQKNEKVYWQEVNMGIVLWEDKK